MTAYEKVMAARDANKLTSVDYIAHMFGDSFIECSSTFCWIEIIRFPPKHH